MNKKVTIIIADDDEGHALLIQRNLKRIGIVNEVIYLKNGEELLEFFDQRKAIINFSAEKFLILLDIKMPRVDGIEVLEKMKGNQITRLIPIIMITTTDNPKEIEACQRLGCNSYILKPIDFEKLIDITQTLNHSLEIVK